MGSSTKKKKEKKRDFQKQKLKVGKARPKPTNFTDTSFKSKGIVLSNQSLHTNAPSPSTQFVHHLSLLSSRSDSQRRDSISAITAIITSRPVNTPLPLPTSVLLPNFLPLVLDGSTSVRTQLLKLLRTIPPREIEDHVEQITLYLRAGLTHLAADIRSSTVEILAWALEVAGLELVTCAGGWVKTLKCYLAMLGWPIETASGSAWSSTKASFGKLGGESKVLARSLTVLAQLLDIGLGPPPAQDIQPSGWGFPLWHTEQHMLPKRSNAFAHLNLFGPPRDEENAMYEERDDRQRIFEKRFWKAVDKGLEGAKREGGDVGRAGAAVAKVLRECMDGYVGEDF